MDWCIEQNGEHEWCVRRGSERHFAQTAVSAVELKKALEAADEQ